MVQFERTIFFPAGSPFFLPLSLVLTHFKLVNFTAKVCPNLWSRPISLPVCSPYRSSDRERIPRHAYQMPEGWDGWLPWEAGAVWLGLPFTPMLLMTQLSDILRHQICWEGGIFWRGSKPPGGGQLKVWPRFSRTQYFFSSKNYWKVTINYTVSKFIIYFHNGKTEFGYPPTSEPISHNFLLKNFNAWKLFLLRIECQILYYKWLSASKKERKKKKCITHKGFCLLNCLF